MVKIKFIFVTKKSELSSYQKSGAKFVLTFSGVKKTGVKFVLQKRELSSFMIRELSSPDQIFYIFFQLIYEALPLS